MIKNYKLFKESLLDNISLTEKERLLKNIKHVENEKPSMDFDIKYGTKLSQEYKFPFGLTADEVWDIYVYNIKYMKKNKLTPQMMTLVINFTNDYFPFVVFKNITNAADRMDILGGMSSGFNKDDIIWFVIDKMYAYKNSEVKNELIKL
jgi:hypothetical protein